MRALKRYLLLGFLLENIMAQTFLMGAVSDAMFYPFMILGLLFLFSPENWSATSLKKFGCIYGLMAIYIVYEFTIGAQYINEKTLQYLAAKLSTFGIMITSINCDAHFYRTKGVKILVIAMAFFLGYGLFTGGGGQDTGRALAGYTNANTAGAMGATLIGMLIFYMRNRKWTFWYWVLVLFGMYGMLAGASRAGFLMLATVLLLRYGLTIKTASFGALIIVVGIYILPSIGIHTKGLERMEDTYNGTEGTNRDVEREAGEWMIKQRPWDGWGYDAKNVGYAKELTLLGSHNGYIELTKQIGIPFAIIYFGIILNTILKRWKINIKRHQKIDLYYAIAIAMLIQANYEGYFVGVHEFGTNLFFMSLTLVSQSSANTVTRFNKKYIR